MKIFVEKSNTNNPYENLAYEAALADYVSRAVSKGQEVYGLFLWQNENSIIFGRNQSIKNECNLKLAMDEGIHLVRRPTGGGAVYHDLGNLNFTFIAKRTDDNKAVNNGIIVKALALLGIEAEISGRNDILADGKKFSGNAYSEKDGVFVQHGTILINLDIDKATLLLTPEQSKLESKGIKSVKSRMINLTEINESIDVASVEAAFTRAFIETNIEACNRDVFNQNISNNKECIGLVDSEINQQIYERELKKMQSDEWLDLNSLKTGFKVNGDFGYFKFSIIENGEKISKISFESDILETELLQYVVNGLEGTPLDEDMILDRFEELTGAYLRPVSSKEKKMLEQIVVAIVNRITSNE